MRFQVLLSLWSFTSCPCIDKIPEVAKTNVSKPKRYSLSKLRLCYAPLKQLIHTRPHMSRSRCGNICIMQPKCSRKERRRDFSNRRTVEAAMTGRRCVFLGESKGTLFGLPKVDAFRNHYSRTAQPRCYHNAFYGWQFREPRRGGNSDFAMTIWCMWISDCKYLLLLV